MEQFNMVINFATHFHMSNTRDNPFENAVSLMSKNAQVDKFNLKELEGNSLLN